MPIHPEDDIGSLERARKRLYEPSVSIENMRTKLDASSMRSLPHKWKETIRSSRYNGKRRVRIAVMFFITALIFFIVAFGAAGYFFYYGGNSVSADKITIDIQGPTTIAGGDTVPLSFIITNKNSVAIENAIIEIDFPNGTRNADDVLSAFPRYVENLGTIPSGGTITRSIKVIMFGGAGESLTLPTSFSYGTANSNATFVKNSSYALAISSTPLSVSVDTITEVISGTQFTITLTVRSNATISMNNVVLSGAFPFGFSVTSSSLPLDNSSLLLGTLLPGKSKTVKLIGTLIGQDNDKRVFHFTIGTAKTPNDQTLAVSYLTQDATVTITAPFINTILSLNGNTAPQSVITSGGYQRVNVSYTNTLQTSIENAMVAVTISGSAIDYDSINTSNGFYQSADHTIVFSRDTDPSLAILAPGASGIGTFSFSTLAPEILPVSPTVTFSVSVSGTRKGQTNVSEEVKTSTTKTAKVATTVLLSSSSLHSSGSLTNSGPIPPRAGQATTYTIVWNVQNKGSAIADGVISTTLPSFVSYTGLATSGFSYDKGSRTVTWNVGNIAQGASAQGSFQVSITPSTSQKGSIPVLTGPASFSGYDRFAGVQVSAKADPTTTETKGDPGYSPTNAIVQ
ncbi:MAG: hypothetical protein V1711_03290 [bacterium]